MEVVGDRFGSGHIVRFIECMDVGHSNDWRMDGVVLAAEIVVMIDAEMPLEPVAPNYPRGVRRALAIQRRQAARLA